MKTKQQELEERTVIKSSTNNASKGGMKKNITKEIETWLQKKEAEGEAKEG